MSNYKPINCSFHDRLLAFATLQKEVNIVFSDDKKERVMKSLIVDVFTRSGEEFMKLESGLIIRLDKIISVNGIRLNES